MLYSAEQIAAAAHRGAVILTVNQRMTRTLLQACQTWQQQQGRRAWAKPAIFTPAQWWQRCVAAAPGREMLLNPAQQHRIWQGVIRDDLGRNNYALLQAGATVKQALKAYATLCEYRLELEEYIALTPEEHAFKRWCAAYLEYCREHEFLDSQQLGPHVLAHLKHGRMQLPTEVWLVGFDELSPLLQEFTRVLSGAGVRVVEPQTLERQATAEVFSFSDTTAEFTAVMDWAFRHIDQGRSVGVVVPDLERNQQVIERVFRRRQRSGDGSDPTGAHIDINLSLGRPLSQYGVIQAALFFLQLEDPLDLNAVSFILRSPWLHGGHTEMQAHMRAEVFLRAAQRSRASLQTYMEMLNHQGLAGSSVSRIFTALHDLMSERGTKSPGYWLETFAALLDAVGWPGDLAPDSETYQILKAWEENVATAFVSLDAVEGKIGRVEAARLLRRLCDETLFQAAAQDQRLQVVGLLEGVALACDAVWITGLSDQVLPAALNFNTFLPVQVQKKHFMPHSSMEREIEFCTRLMAQFRNLAPEVRLSCAGAEEDGTVVGPSPFLPPAAPHVDESASMQRDMDASGSGGGMRIRICGRCPRPCPRAWF